MKNLSNWRSVRVIETALERDLRQHHVLGLHGVCIGALVLLAMWAIAHLQMRMGVDSLGARYAVTLGTGYLAYVFVLRVWAAALLRHRQSRSDGSFDLPDLGWSSASSPGSGSAVSGGSGPDWPLPGFHSGGGGDFGGGGASGDFGGDGGLGSIGDAAGSAIDGAGAVDEGAIVVVPVVAMFVIGSLLLLGVGSILLLYFGSDALLAVAIELAFSFAAGRTALAVAREGWLGAVIRLTWKPLLGALVCGVGIGLALDHYVPQAHSLAQALQLLAKARH